MPAEAEYTALQLAGRLGLAAWQLRLAIRRRLLPGPDLEDARWSAERAAECLLGVEKIRAALGDEPPVGALKAAARLAERILVDVDKADIESLVLSDALDIAGHYRGHPLYSSMEIDALSPDLVIDVVRARKGRLFETVDAKSAATILGWPREVFDRIGADRSLATDQLGRYALADIRDLAHDAEVRQLVEHQERALALETARAAATRAEEAVTTWLHRCTAYLNHTTESPPPTTELTSALRALTTARSQLAPP